MLRSRKRTWFCIAALALVLIFSLGACSGPGSGKVLRVGIDNTYPPMEYKDDSGKDIGFDIDLSQAIAKKLNMKVEFVPTAWTAIFLALDSDKFDCIISSLSITDERKKSIAFTRPYIANTQVIVVKTDNNTIKTAEDLKDKKVGVQMGTTAEEACTKFNEKTPFKEFPKYEMMTEAFADLKAGRVDTVVTDLVVGKYYVAKDKQSFKMMEAGLPSEPIGIGCKLDNTQLRDRIDKALEEMMNDGSLKKISEKWFGEDMTANIK